MKPKKSRKLAVAQPLVSGQVTYLDIKGVGPNSAQLLFTVENKKTGQKVPLTMTAPPAFMPQVFTSVAAFVTAAYFSGKPITACYMLIPGETSQVIEVYAPV